MALAEMGLGLNGIGLNGYWPNWELDQVALDEMGLDEVAIDQENSICRPTVLFIINTPSINVPSIFFHLKKHFFSPDSNISMYNVVPKNTDFSPNIFMKCHAEVLKIT